MRDETERFRAPWKLPGYRLEGLLGRGASGGVWRARTASGDPVALKRIPLGNAGAIRAAQSEAALLMALDHPHLIRLHELVPTRDAVVLVLDLAAGGSLAELFDSRGWLAVGEVVTALAPIGAALAYAHAAGVVHGDVSPANILFTPVGFPLLADLGVSRILGDRVEVRSTPAYIDPSIADGGFPTPQSDVFMLGAVALHALTGSPPWPVDSAEHALAAASAGRLGDVAGRLRAAGVPGDVRNVVARALSRDPGARGTAAEFALDLRHAAEPTPVELSAGRARVQPPVVAPAVVAPAVVAPQVAEGAGAPVVPPAPPVIPPAAASAPAPQRGRPDFDRPQLDRTATDEAEGTEPAGGASAVHTHSVLPRPRPDVGRRRWQSTSLFQRARPRWLVAAGCAVLLAAGAGVAFSQLASDSDTHRRAAGSVAPSDSPRTEFKIPIGGDSGSLSPTATVTSASPTATADLTAATKALAELDAKRQDAFARRAPTLLTGVYVAGPLLDQDVALLKRIVPAGCGLEGVHTAYSEVKVLTSTATTLEVSATATLAQSILICQGKAKARAGGSGPTALRITLVKQGTGYLIADIQD